MKVILKWRYPMDIKVVVVQFLGEAFKRCFGRVKGSKVLIVILLGIALCTSSINAASDQPPTGLQNRGRTCFVNATLQCLFKMNLLNTSPQCTQNQAPIVQEYLRLIGNHANIENFIAAVRSTIGMARGQEEDAHEFLMRFLDILDPRAAFVRLHGTETMNCGSCHAASANAGRPFTLELEIDQPGSCFDHYFMQGETVSANTGNGWRCPQCQRPVDATKKYTLQTLPDYLTIQLKRFRQQSVGVYQRLDTAVSYPEKFSFDPRYFVPQAHVPHAYELFGVVMQTGSLTGGHYTAYVKHNNSWMLCSDDAQIVPRPLPQNSSEPYILFYRKTTDLTGAVVHGPMINQNDDKNAASNKRPHTNANANDKADSDAEDEGGKEPGTKKRRTENSASADQPYNLEDYARAKKGGKNLNLTNARLDRADLSDVNLIGANLTGASMRGANLTRANLKGAQFVKTDLTDAVLHETMVDNAVFDGANLTHAKISKTRHFDNVEIKNNTRFFETEFRAVLFHNAMIKNSTFLRSTLNGVVFNNSNIEQTSMRNIKAKGLSFLATSLYSVDFTLAHICEFYIVGNNVIGCDLNFQYATLSQGFIAGGRILPEGNTEGVERDYSPYMSYCIADVVRHVNQPTPGVDSRTVDAILEESGINLKELADSIEEKIIRSGWWATWANEPSTIVSDIAERFKSGCFQNFIPGETYRGLILITKVIPMIAQVAKKFANNEVRRRCDEIIAGLNTAIDGELRKMSRSIQSDPCNTGAIYRILQAQNRELLFASISFRSLSVIYDIKRKIELLHAAEIDAERKASEYDSEIMYYDQAASSVGHDRIDNRVDLSTNYREEYEAKAASCRASAEEYKFDAQRYSYMQAELKNLLKQNSMVIDSDFRGVKMENVLFSHLYFSCCKNINLCRSMAGCKFEYIFDSSKVCGHINIYDLSLEFSHETALKEKGAMVNGRFDEGFSPMWGKTNYQGLR